MMKIVQLIYSLSSGGAERFVVDLSNELAMQGNEVYLIIYRNDNDSEFYKHILSDKVILINLNVKAGLRISAFTKTISTIRKIQPDVVHCHLNVIPYIFLLALISKKTKYFHTLHNLAHKTSGHKFQKSLNKYFYKKMLIKPITISNACDKSYQDFYELYNSSVVENGRATVIADENYSDIENEVKKYTNSANTLIFIHVARFDTQKNQGLLVNVFNRLEEEGVDFILLIIGGGYTSPAGITLQKRACKSIKFLGEKKNINNYYLLSDAFCLSSIYEGLPISLLEALAAGCTPICTPAGGIPDVISDGINGYLSKDMDELSYYSAIKRYIDNPESIKKEVLSDFYNKNYSIANCASRHISLYNLKI